MAEESDTAADNAADQTGQGGQQTDDSSQQQSSGDADASQNQASDDSVSRAELNKVIGERQATKERARTAETALAEMQAKVAGMPDPEALKKFQEWEAAGSAEARDAAMKAGDVEAIENGVREPLQAKIGALETKLSNRDAQLSAVLKEQALRVAATECGAHNPEQVMTLLRDRVRMVEQPDGRFVPEYLNAEGTPMYDGAAQSVTDAKVFVELVLALPENANLVKSTIVPGSGAKQPGGQQPSGDDGMPATIEEFMALPDEKRAELTQKLGTEGISKFLGIGEEKIPNTL